MLGMRATDVASSTLKHISILLGGFILPMLFDGIAQVAKFPQASLIVLLAIPVEIIVWLRVVTVQIEKET